MATLAILNVFFKVSIAVRLWNDNGNNLEFGVMQLGQLIINVKLLIKYASLSPVRIGLRAHYQPESAVVVLFW